MADDYDSTPEVQSRPIRSGLQVLFVAVAVGALLFGFLYVAMLRAIHCARASNCVAHLDFLATGLEDYRHE